MKLTIITISFNCLDNLKKTVFSVLRQRSCDIEFIVIDGGSVDGTKEFLENNPEITKWVSEPDRGIYDAMNKGIRLATGNALFFLNAGDFLVGDFLHEINFFPCFIPVKTKRGGLNEMILKPKSFRLGLPYCHQGIIFENKKILYDLSYGIASDYDFYLRHSYRSLPLLEIKGGYVQYDNFGISTKKSAQRDREIAKIIKINFGSLESFYFIVYAKSKSFVKTFLGILRLIEK